MAAMYIADSRQVAAAVDLIAAFGDHAGLEAAIRAGRSRDVGNHVHYCRWRQIERLIDLMALPGAVGTIH